MSYTTRGGGGGGFGGFPYRSSHQQGNDHPRRRSNDNNNNSNNNGNNNKSKKYQRRQKRGGPITCHARLRSIPWMYRKYLIRFRATLMEETKCQINVQGTKRNTQQQQQQRQQSPLNNNGNYQLSRSNTFKVDVQASCLEHLLHGCWEVLYLISHYYYSDCVTGQETDITNQQELQQSKNSCDNNNHNNKDNHDKNRLDDLGISYTIELKGILTLDGNHININHREDNKGSAFLSGVMKPYRNMTETDKNNPENVGCGEMVVYCIKISQNERKGTTNKIIHPDDIFILVDNERFIDPTMLSHVHVVSVSRFKDYCSMTNTRCSDNNTNNRNIKSKNGSDDNMDDKNLLVFFYGSTSDKTLELYQKIQSKVSFLQTNETYNN